MSNFPALGDYSSEYSLVGCRCHIIPLVQYSISTQRVLLFAGHRDAHQIPLTRISLYNPTIQTASLVPIIAFLTLIIATLRTDRRLIWLHTGTFTKSFKHDTAGGQCHIVKTQVNYIEIVSPACKSELMLAVLCL